VFSIFYYLLCYIFDVIEASLKKLKRTLKQWVAYFFPWPCFLYFLKRIEKRADLVCQRKSFKKLLEDSDILYGCEMHFGSEYAYLIAKEMNKQFIYDVKEHYEFEDAFPQYVRKHIVKKEEAYFDLCLAAPCVAEGIQKSLQIKHPEHAHKIRLLENAMPYSALLKEKDIKKNKEPVKLIVSLGAITPHRGIKELLQIWEQLAPKNAYLDIRCSNLNEKMQKILTRIAPTTHTQSWSFIDAVTEDDMVKSMRGYHYGVIPYLPTIKNHHFCCPNKFGQYLNAGMGVISSNTQNIPVKIKTFNLGLIYDPMNLQASVDALAALFDDSSLIQLHRINALKCAEKGFEWEEQCNAFIDSMESDMH